MGERPRPNWRLVERIVLIVEMAVEILNRLRLP
jgi:hypothetical protein